MYVVADVLTGCIIVGFFVYAFYSWFKFIHQLKLKNNKENDSL